MKRLSSPILVVLAVAIGWFVLQQGNGWKGFSIPGLGGGAMQSPGDQVAEELLELLLSWQRQLMPQLEHGEWATVPRQRRGGTSRLADSDMIHHRFVDNGVADTSAPVLTAPPR